MTIITSVWKWLAVAFGGMIGWVIAEFSPTFPLVVVAVVLIMSDAWTAYQLDKRVHRRYPDKRTRPAKFTSFAFGKVVTTTIPKRLWLIILAYIVERWVFIDVNVPLSYVAAGAIAFEQFWSMLENEASCRDDASDSRFWKLLQKILIDKTERHFDVNLGDLKEGVDEEQVSSARKRTYRRKEAKG